MRFAAELDLYEESRGECLKQASVCDFITCRHNMTVDTVPDPRGGRQSNTPILVRERCSLLMDTQLSLEEIGNRIGASRERANQVFHVALRKFIRNWKERVR